MNVNLGRKLLEGLAVAVLVAGCTSAGASPTSSRASTPTASPGSPFATPVVTAQATTTPAPSPSPTTHDPLVPVVRLINALGGHAAMADQWERGPSDSICQDSPLSGNLNLAGSYAWNGTWCAVWYRDGTLMDLLCAGPSQNPAPSPPTSTKATTRLLQLRDILEHQLGSLPANGKPKVAPYYDEGFRAEWDRTVDGVPVQTDYESDGVMISVYLDGTFMEYTYQWSPIGPKPAKTLSKAQALAKAGCKPGKCSAPTLTWFRWSDDPSELTRLTWIIDGPNPCSTSFVDAETGEASSDGAGCV